MKGQLTPFQEKASKGLLKAVDSQQPTLVHAVTGAVENRDDSSSCGESH